MSCFRVEKQQKQEVHKEQEAESMNEDEEEAEQPLLLPATSVLTMYRANVPAAAVTVRLPSCQELIAQCEIIHKQKSHLK